MNKLYKNKFLIVLISVSLLIFFVRTIPHESLVDRAIAISIGIDYKENEFLVSLEIITPIGGSKQATNDGYAIVYENGKTMGAAIDKIEQRLGLKVSISHCNVVILGREMTKQPFMPALNYLITSWQIPEQAILVASATTALDIQRAFSVLAINSGFEIQRSLGGHGDNIYNVSTKIKNFIIDYISKSGSGFMTLIELADIPSEDAGNVSSFQESTMKFKRYKYEKSIVINRRTECIELEKNNTVALSLMRDNSSQGTITVPYQDKIYGIRINDNKVMYKVKMEGKKGSVRVGVKLEARLMEVEYLSDDLGGKKVTKQILTEIGHMMEKQLEQQIRDTFTFCQAEKSDVYGLYDKMYAYCGKDWAHFKSADEDYLPFIDFDVTCQISIVKG